MSNHAGVAAQDKFLKADGGTTMSEVDEMIEVGGVMRPSTYDQAAKLAEAQSAPIRAARDEVDAAQQNLLEVCVKQYPVGSRVNVNIAAGRTPQHEVVSINEYGWLTLRNTQTGTKREMRADSTSISPCTCWYTKEIRHLSAQS
jgi:hypothetical protein